MNNDETVAVTFEDTIWYKRVYLEYKNDINTTHTMESIRSKWADFINKLEEVKNEKNGRLISLAETQIEEAVMWAIKAINQ